MVNGGEGRGGVGERVGVGWVKGERGGGEWWW